MLSLLPGDRLWNCYRVESVAAGCAWLAPLHELRHAAPAPPPVLLFSLQRGPALPPLAELLSLAGTAARWRAGWETGSSGRQQTLNGISGHAAAFHELPLLGRAAWVGDPARDGVALVEAPPATPLAEMLARSGPLTAPAVLDLLTRFTGALDAFLQTTGLPPQGAAAHSVLHPLARLLHPGGVALRADNAHPMLCIGVPPAAVWSAPPQWPDFLAPELYCREEATSAAWVFGLARLGTFLLGAAAEPARAAEAAWAALADWACGRRDAAREFLAQPAAAQAPDELRGILATCLAQAPARRVPTPGKLHVALLALAGCPWSQGGVRCEACGLVLAADSAPAPCPCCGRRAAVPGGTPQAGDGVPRAPRGAGLAVGASAATGASATQAAVQLESMTLIAAGTFLSGESKTPRNLRAFAIDTVPVTEGDYKRFLAETGRVPRRGGPGSRGPELDRHPVTRVTWYEANEYAEFHGKRLPTVFEWEKAARGTDGRRFPSGSAFQTGAGRARRGARAAEPAAPRGTTPVGVSPAGASPYGVLDLTGNVLQWTSTARRAGQRLCRAVKGSCYLDGSRELARCAGVQYLPPENALPYLGFRCVKDVE